jgi:hypothetical protein
MVKYLSKFVLEVLPSIVATVVGAYIVAHYINPRPEAPKAAMVATAPAGEAKDATEATGTVGDKAADAKDAEVKATDAKPADTAKADTAKADAAKPRSAAKSDEKKNAIELARAAIERLRGSTTDTPAAPQPVRAPAAPVETARTDDSARVAVQAPPATPRAPVATPVVSTTGLAPQPAQPAPVTAAALPALPPPVVVASPYGRHSVGPEAPTSIVPTDQPADQANADRPTPPADIPFQRGYDLQAQAAPVEHVSIADHVLSTTKSFFRALTPNSQSN